MKVIISFILIVLSCQTVKSQNDSLREVYQNYPLIHVIDSISVELRNAGKSVELALVYVNGIYFNGFGKT